MTYGILNEGLDGKPWIYEFVDGEQVGIGNVDQILREAAAWQKHQRERYLKTVAQVWAAHLPIQQQSVLLLATRGPDGMRKHHPAKKLIQCYRAVVLNAATTGEPLGERQGDSFMNAYAMGNDDQWAIAVSQYFDSVDEIPHHYHNHLMHGAQIIGYKHPDPKMRLLWGEFYGRCADDAHLVIESEATMDDRLNDFGANPGGSQIKQEDF